MNAHNHIRWTVLSVTIFALSSCSDDDGPTEPSGAVSFAQVQTILAADCKGCHDPGGGRIFSTGMDSAQLAQSGLVDPTNPSQSLLILKPTNAVPHGGGLITALTADDQSLITNWIAALPPFTGALVSAILVGGSTGIPAPTPDGFYDVAWDHAPPTTYLMGGGWADAQSVMVKAAYDDTYLYLLLAWDDDKASLRRQPWVKNIDGTWSSLPAKTPAPTDGTTWQQYMGSGFNEEDAARFNYEDKLAIMWNTYGTSTVAGFDQSGCATVCHDPRNSGKPGTTYFYSNENLAAKKFTNAAAEIADLWHWKLVRNNQHAKMDDQYVRYWAPGSGGAAEGGRASDAGAAGYGGNPSTSGHPTYRGPSAGAPPYYIFDSEKRALTHTEAAALAAGTEIPNMITSGPTGARADIDAKAMYSPTVRGWVMEIRRKLVTSDVTDVQFNDLDRQYSFGVAVFDNAQIEHSYMSSVGRLMFKR